MLTNVRSGYPSAALHLWVLIGKTNASLDFLLLHTNPRVAFRITRAGSGALNSYPTFQTFVLTTSSAGVDRLLLNTTHSWIFKAQHAAERTSGLGTDGSAFEPIKLFDLPSWHAELQSETWPAGVEISQGNEEETNQGTRGDVLFYAQ
ncbi:hypothetical protein KCU99_g396, partial [Aureobasidium melanogenum]